MKISENDIFLICETKSDLEQSELYKTEQLFATSMITLVHTVLWMADLALVGLQNEWNWCCFVYCNLKYTLKCFYSNFLSLRSILKICEFD